MRKYIPLFALACTLWLAGCDGEQLPDRETIEITQDGASALVVDGYGQDADASVVLRPSGADAPLCLSGKTLAGEGYRFLWDTADRLDAMDRLPSTEAAWMDELPVVDGRTCWVRYAEGDSYRFVKLRIAYVVSGRVGLEYLSLPDTQPQPNKNRNPFALAASVTRYEMPAIDGRYLFVEHSVGDELNYALEWNGTKKHANWVAFSFDSRTCADNVKRTDAWAEDPLLPADQRTDNTYHTNDGFDRGHLCASEDRVYSKEANQQTFYYSNMSPQLNDLNSGLWQKLESRVQQWGRTCATSTGYDHVYVAKGGTMNELLISFRGTQKGNDQKYPTTDARGFTVKGLACPKYYFMAVLAEKKGKYQAIAFLVEHREGHPKAPGKTEMQAYALSVRELEKRTGIDFFCNLPDGIEETVEETFRPADWSW